jgi:hypothetical protein
MPRIPRETEDRVISLYLSDRSMTIEEISNQCGVSRQSVYTILERNGISPQRLLRDHDSRTELIPDDLLDRMARQALQVMLEELVTGRRRAEALEAWVRAHGGDPDLV